MSSTSFTAVQDVLAPVRSSLGPLGTNITPRQPDVEILGMLMTDLPMTSSAFENMRRANEWVSMSVAVVAVGPPGFSSVPYTSTKKTGERDENTQALYTVTDDGNTMFSTFEKAKNNKDRGSRAVKMGMDGSPDSMIDATAVLEPGVCLSTFIREDVYSPSSTFFVHDESVLEVDSGVIRAGSLVYMQLGTKNVEQAMKGQLIKFKKIKICRNASCAISTFYNSIPTDSDAFRSVCQRSVETYPAIGKQVQASSKYAMIGGVCPKHSYVSYSDIDRKIILSGFLGHITDTSGLANAEVVFCADSLMRDHGFSDPSRLTRWINIAISSMAVGIAVFCKTLYGENTDKIFYHGSALNIDLNVMLGLPIIYSMNSLEGLQPEDFSAKLLGDVFVWSKDDILYNSACDGSKRKIVFSLNMKQGVCTEPWNTENSTLLISDGCCGTFNRLSLFSVEMLPTAANHDQDLWQEIGEAICHGKSCTHDAFNLNLLISTQVRTENRGQMCSKRKRPQMCCDEYD